MALRYLCHIVLKRLWLLPFVFCFASLKGSAQYMDLQMGRPDNTSPVQYQNPQPQVSLGASAQSIEQQNRRIYATDHPYQNKQAQQQAEITTLVAEMNRDINRRVGNGVAGAANEAAIVANAKPFEAALQHLQDMLDGRAALSVADAYFTIENAFGKPYLKRKEFDDIIKQSAAFIRKWMQQNGLDPKDNLSAHYAVQKFMSQTLTVSETVTSNDGKATFKTTQHQPFYYDYDDFEAYKDHRNFFVTKCLATGSGQCSSMPAVYLILAEAIGTKAYLTLAPMHSFVKYPDNYGYIQNYEPTSNWEISDQWYKDNLFISPEAVRSGLYLDTLNSRQVVANCAFDIAFGYTRQTEWWDHDFIRRAIFTGVPHFPRNNNLIGLAMYSVLMKSQLLAAMRHHGITDIDKIGGYSDVQAIYRDYVANEGYIKSLGYEETPQELYQSMMNEHEFKGRMQKMKNFDGKQKRNLFISMDAKP